MMASEDPTQDLSEALASRAGRNEIETFIERVLDGVQSENTRRGYRRAIAAFVAFMAERREPLSKALLNEFKAGLRAEGRGDAAINQALSAVRFFLREAATDGRLDPVEVERACKVENVKARGKKAGNWLTKRETETLLEAPDGMTALAVRDRAILAVLLGAGLRRSECASLEVRHLQQREGRWALVDVVGKRNKARTVPVAPWVAALIQEWLRAANITQGRMFRQASWSENKFVVSETPLSDKGVARVCARYSGRDGVPGIAAHDARRTFAKLARDGGADIEQVMLALGHQSLEVTQEYLGVKLDFQDSASDRLGLKVRL
jgi:site-specific recombinase XerD